LSIVHSLNINNPYVPRHTLEKELRLPDLECFEFGPLPELDSFDESITSNETPLQEPDEDLWEAALELGPANKDVIFYTWETFETPNHVERQTTYITERGSEAYDVALVADDSKVSAGRVVKGDVLLQSLLNLGLGRSSILFNFNRKLKTFESVCALPRA
jgi:hypothetical protein